MLELFRATGIECRQASTTLPETLPPGARLRDRRPRQPCRPCNRPPPEAVAPRRRCSARSRSARRRWASLHPATVGCHRPRRAAGRRGPGRPSVRDRESRSPMASERPGSASLCVAGAGSRGVPRNAGGRARRLAQHDGGLRRRSRDLAGLPRSGASRSRPTADAAALRAYLKSLDYVGMTPRTVARRLSVIRQFFRFLLAERMREDDPASTLDSPRARPAAAQGAVARGGRPADRGGPRRGSADGGRMATLLEILYATGLRVSELVTLPLSAVRARSDGADRARQGRQGTAWCRCRIPPGAAIAQWLHVRAATLGDGRTSRFLFPSRGATGHLTRQRFAQLLKEAALAAEHRSGARFAARAAPRLRQPSARGRRRPAQRAADARPCRHRHHADLHARAGREVARAGAGQASAGAPATRPPAPVDRVRVPRDT